MGTIRYGRTMVVLGLVLAAGAVGDTRRARGDEPPPLNDACIRACNAQFDRNLDACRRGKADGSEAFGPCEARARNQTDVCRSRCGGEVAGSLECFATCRESLADATQRCQEENGAGTDAMDRCLEKAQLSMGSCSERCEKAMTPEAPPPAAR